MDSQTEQVNRPPEQNSRWNFLKNFGRNNVGKGAVVASAVAVGVAGGEVNKANAAQIPNEGIGSPKVSQNDGGGDQEMLLTIESPKHSLIIDDQKDPIFDAKVHAVLDEYASLQMDDRSLDLETFRITDADGNSRYFGAVMKKGTEYGITILVTENSDGALIRLSSADDPSDSDATIWRAHIAQLHGENPDFYYDPTKFDGTEEEKKQFEKDAFVNVLKVKRNTDPDALMPIITISQWNEMSGEWTGGDPSILSNMTQGNFVGK